MPKAKKSDSEKAAKIKPAKPVKPPKAEKLPKPAAEKKAKKKDKPEPAVVAALEPAAKLVKTVKKIITAKLPKAVGSDIVLSLEEISLRAYFIAERRQAMGWEGDSAQDWIEAERQLKAEAKRKKK